MERLTLFTCGLVGPTKLHRFSKVETLPQVCLERDLTMKDGQGDAAININKTTLVNSSIVHNRCISLKKINDVI